MSTYEDDHNISTPHPQSTNRSRDHQTLSTAINSFLTSETPSASSVNSSEIPSREAFSNALRMLNDEEGSALAQSLLSSLEDDSSGPKKGVDQDYLDALDRVDINSLDDDADCPICTNKFTQDDHPLIVKLPCNAKGKGHIFDLECVGPWLKMNSTCPICRFNLLELAQKRRQRLDEELKQIKAEVEEEEEDDWDAYG